VEALREEETLTPAGRYNPGHEHGRSYGGYARGWQRRPYRGYRYSGSRFNGSVGRGGGDQRIGQTDHHVNGARTPVHHQASAGVVSSRRGASDPHVQEVFRAQKAGKVEAGEPQVPEVFKNEKCPILKQPRLLAHPCGYDVSGLGFYHIPHASITFGRSDNRLALVTVQGGVLSIPQLVAELSRLIPERWLWDVTQQDDHTFIVSFPSRGDLQRSVAFGKADIKEHGVNLLFEEWKQEEEGMALQRVWIRIFRLKLREFSVLWALGSMLGATQSVDMISSLKRDYGRVEVAVLNVDLLPNSIDTIVIGDRLFSLPIQVEGF
jgi:hypothetical protein